LDLDAAGLPGLPPAANVGQGSSGAALVSFEHVRAGGEINVVVGASAGSRWRYRTEIG
jgi:hypothetical protein